MSKYPMVSCSQCGQSFGPGDSGYSACSEHRLHRPPMDMARIAAASRAAQASAKLLNAGITPTACHCVGPQMGEPVCPCAMRSVRVVNGRYVRTTDLGPAPACIDTPEQGEHL